MKILIIHGPQLSLLGKVSSQNGNRLTLDKVNKTIRKKLNSESIEFKIFQVFSPKNIIKALITNRNEVDGIVLNLGGMSRGFFAIQEILAINNIPVVEVMMSEYPFSKENFDNSVLKNVAEKRVYKSGLSAYIEALDHFIKKK